MRRLIAEYIRHEESGISRWARTYSPLAGKATLLNVSQRIVLMGSSQALGHRRDTPEENSREGEVRPDHMTCIIAAKLGGPSSPLRIPLLHITSSEETNTRH